MITTLLLCAALASDYRPGPPRPGTGWILKGLSGVRVGVVQPLEPGERYRPSIIGMVEGTIEADQFAVRGAIGGLYAIGDSDRLRVRGGLLDASFIYYLLDSKLTPYFGGGLSPRVVKVEQIRFTLVPYALTGLYWGGDVVFTLEARAGQNVLPNEGRVPSELSLVTGVHW